MRPSPEGEKKPEKAGAEGADRFLLHISDVISTLRAGWDGSIGTPYADAARNGPGRLGDCSPRLPQIRTCATHASGSSRQGFTSRFAIRGCYVDPQPEYKAPGGCPTHDSMTSILLPSTGSPRYRCPCVNGTMKMCDVLRPSRRASFPSLGDTMRCACCFAPVSPRRQAAGQGCVIRSPLPERVAWKRSGPPRFLENPVCLCPVLRPRQDRRNRPYVASTWPPYAEQRGLLAIR